MVVRPFLPFVPKSARLLERGRQAAAGRKQSQTTEGFEIGGNLLACLLRSVVRWSRDVDVLDLVESFTFGRRLTQGRARNARSDSREGRRFHKHKHCPGKGGREGLRS